MDLRNNQQLKRSKQSSQDKETTPLLVESHSNDFRGFLNTDEEDRESIAKKTVFGEVRNMKRLGWIEWVFLIIASFTMLGLLGMSIERFVSIHNSFKNFTPASGSGSGDGNGSVFGIDGHYGVGLDEGVGANSSITDCDEWTCLNDFLFALLLLLNLACCAFYCYDGILRERPFEMIGYAVGMFVIMIYVIINYSLEGNQGDTTRLVRLVMVIIVCPQSIVLAFVVQYRMGYLVLNTIGSNQSLTKAYHSRSLFIIVQRFNLQILANIFVLSWAKNGHFTSTSEKVALPFLLVYMFVISYIGWIAVVWEYKMMSIVWFFLIMPSVGLFVYKVINVAVHWTDYEKQYIEYYINGNPPDVAHFTIDATVIIVLCVLGLFCCIAMSVLMLTTMKNFGKGLKDRLPPPCFNYSKKDTGTIS